MPQVGDALLDSYEFVGLVIDVLSLDKNNLFFVEVEWYAAGEVYRAVYRVGNDRIGNSNYTHMSHESYSKMKKDFINKKNLYLKK